MYCDVIYDTYLSWTTIVVHSRYNQEIGMAHKVKLPENQPQLSQATMGWYWLGKIKSKVFFKSCHGILNFLGNEICHTHIAEYVTS